MGDMENTTTPTAQMDMSNHTSNMTDQLEDMGNGSHSDHSQDPHATHLGYDPENKHVNVLVMDHVHDDNNHHMHHPDAHMDQSSCYWVTDDALFSKMCFQVCVCVCPLDLTRAPVLWVAHVPTLNNKYHEQFDVVDFLCEYFLLNHECRKRIPVMLKLNCNNM